jgi:hypothetical protein
MAMKEHFVVPQRVLDECRSFFQERGREGCEGTGLWTGRQEGDSVRITRFIAPEQRCIRTAHGLRVELTERAHYTLTDLLSPDELFYARIHSHPKVAYHSDTDDENEILSHKGAISIVVPNFARDPIKLRCCAIYRLEHGQGWLKLNEVDVGALFEVSNE